MSDLGHAESAVVRAAGAVTDVASELQAAAATPTVIARVRPDVRPLSGLWDFFVRGARPTAFWVCVAGLFTELVVLRLGALLGVQVTPLDFGKLACLVGPIMVHQVTRSREIRDGCA